MLSYAVTFLVISLLSGVLLFSNTLGATASAIAWILFWLGLIFAAIFFLVDRSQVGYDP